MGQIAQIILETLFPRRCIGCSKIGSYLCPACQKTLRPPLLKCPVCNTSAIDGFTHPGCEGKHHVSGAIPLIAYTSVIRRCIHYIKYKHVFSAVEEIVQIIWNRSDTLSKIRHIPRIYMTEGIIIPIPVHPLRLRERGYNQADIIAKCIARIIRRPIYPGALMRTKNTQPQVVGAKREIRLKNMSDAFTVPNTMRPSIAGVYVLLIDDVVTTGATIRSAGKELLRAGARGVWVISIA